MRSHRLSMLKRSAIGKTRLSRIIGHRTLLSDLDSKLGARGRGGFSPILVDTIARTKMPPRGEGIRTLDPNLGKVVR
jgi:hypothetical protein